jgi:cysteine synthase A
MLTKNLRERTMDIYESIAEITNDTTFVTLGKFLPTDIYLKLEGLNLAGSIKLKTALGLIESLEKRGLIRENSILIESSSGNLGVALSMVCASRGLHFTCVVDPNTSAHNKKIMRAYGTTVVMVEKLDANGGYLGTRIAYVKETIQRDARYLWLDQYTNPANPQIHSRMTAASIAAAFPHIDYMFVGAGTTGTLMGCVNYFRAHRPTTKIIAVDSVGSVTFGQPAAKRYIPGLGASRQPPIFDTAGLHALEQVPESDAIVMCRYLARERGLLAGGSTGTVLAGLYGWRERIPEGATVVAISPDFGERYLDTIYDDDWVLKCFGESSLAGEIDRIQASSQSTIFV